MKMRLNGGPPQPGLQNNINEPIVNLKELILFSLNINLGKIKQCVDGENI